MRHNAVNRTALDTCGRVACACEAFETCPVSGHIGDTFIRVENPAKRRKPPLSRAFGMPEEGLEPPTRGL